MKQLMLGVLLFFTFCSCEQNVTKQKEQAPPYVDADSLVAHLDQFIGKRIKTTGQTIHLCGVFKHKMKLQTTSGEGIKLIYPDSTKSFNPALNKQYVEVVGVVQESRIAAKSVDQMEKETSLLCSIDHRPCIDEAWVAGKIEKGSDVAISAEGIKELRDVMEQTEKDYISVPIIKVEEIISNN